MKPINEPLRDETGQWMTEGERVTILERELATLRGAVDVLAARLRKAEVALGIPVVYVPKRDKENEG